MRWAAAATLALAALATAAAAQGQAGPRLVLVKVKVERTADLGGSMKAPQVLTALCPAGSVPFWAGWSVGSGQPSSLLPVQRGARAGWEGEIRIWDPHGAPETTSITAVCARGEGGLSVRATGAGVNAGPPSANVTVRFVVAHVPRTVTDNNPLGHPSCPAGSAPVAYGWRHDLGTGLLLSLAGTYTKWPHAISLQFHPAGTYNMEVAVDALDVCLEAKIGHAAVGTSGVRYTFPREPGPSATYRLSCPRGATPVGLPVFGFTAGYSADPEHTIDPTVTGAEPTPRGKGSVVRVWPLQPVQSPAPVGSVSIAQHCLVTSGWTVDTSHL